jgi:hypothetical protein
MCTGDLNDLPLLQFGDHLIGKSGICKFFTDSLSGFLPIPSNIGEKKSRPNTSTSEHDRSVYDFDGK